jgi:hypothetical protein
MTINKLSIMTKIFTTALASLGNICDDDDKDLLLTASLCCASFDDEDESITASLRARALQKGNHMLNVLQTEDIVVCLLVGTRILLYSHQLRSHRTFSSILLLLPSYFVATRGGR